MGPENFVNYLLILHARDICVRLGVKNCHQGKVNPFLSIHHCTEERLRKNVV